MHNRRVYLHNFDLFLVCIFTSDVAEYSVLFEVRNGIEHPDTSDQHLSVFHRFFVLVDELNQNRRNEGVIC